MDSLCIAKYALQINTEFSNKWVLRLMDMHMEKRHLTIVYNT